MQSNKGRFKCPHEAQAVWNFYATRWTSHSEESLLWYCKDFEDRLSTDLHVLATNLHQARLIHGTIYDEDGRIENKDVAHEEYLEGVFDVNIFSSNEPCKYGDDPRIFNEFIFSGQNTQVRGTIFY